MQHFMISLWELIGIKEDITLLNFNKIWAKSFMKIGVWDCKIDNHNLVSNFNDIHPLNLWSFICFQL